MSEVECPLCERPTPSSEISDHHLVPKSKGGKETEPICNPCHRQIHALYDNWTLANRLNTVESLREDERFAKYLKWAAKQPPGKRFKTKSSNPKKGRRR